MKNIVAGKISFLTLLTLLTASCQDAKKSSLKQMFENSVRRDPTAEELQHMVSLGGCTAYFVANNAGKVILGSARHCFGHEEAAWCEKPGSFVDDKGLHGSCIRIVASDPEHDIMLFEASYAGEMGKNRGFRLAAYHPAIDTRLGMLGYPADRIRQGHATLTENCWVLSDVKGSPFSESTMQDPSQAHNCSTYGGNSGGPIFIEGSRDVIGLPFTYVPNDYGLRPEDMSPHAANFASMADFVARHRTLLEAEGILISTLAPKARSTSRLLTVPGGQEKITTSRPDSSDDTNPRQAFDGKPETSWEVSVSSAWIQYEFAEGKAYTLDAYSLTSAPDKPNRDPDEWVLSGSNDGLAWFMIDQQADQSFARRLARKTFPIAEQRAFKKYRLSLKNSTQNSTLQLGEISLQGRPGTPLNPLITASDENGYSEGMHKAFDGSTATKWLTFSADGWIEYDARIEVDIAAYAVASANDFPGRDPASWKLEASHDGFQWVTLDSQDNQTFEQRFQLKSFPLEHRTFYRFYRFTFEAKEGPFLQLSEIQLLGRDQLL